MYANLRTVDGDSNHFVVRSTLPLTDEQADLVRIISTDDPGLALYADDDYALTWTQLRSYLSDRPGVRITYASGQRDRGAGPRGRPSRSSSSPSPSGGRSCCSSGPSTSHSPERCVPLFGPAR